MFSIFKSTSRRLNVVCCLPSLPTSREDGGRVARVPISHCSPVQPAEGGPELLWWALSPVAGQWLRGLRLGQLTRWTPRAVGQPCGNAKFDSPLCSPKAMPLCLMTINHYSLTKLTAANTLFTLSCWDCPHFLLTSDEEQIRRCTLVITIWYGRLSSGGREGRLETRRFLVQSPATANWVLWCPWTVLNINAWRTQNSNRSH